MALPLICRPQTLPSRGPTTPRSFIRLRRKGAGITVNLIQEPADGYWSNVWLKKPWCACFWSGRATEDLMFSTAYEVWRAMERHPVGPPALPGTADQGSHRGRYSQSAAISMSKCRTFCGSKVAWSCQCTPTGWMPESTKITNGGAPFGNVYQMDSARIAERWWFA